MATMEKLWLDFPETWTLDGGMEATVRPMVKGDRDKLLQFFTQIPGDELRLLKDDVTDARVIDQWARDLNYDRVLPLVVEVGGRIIADASLHRRKQGWRRHLGSVRVVVDPAYRSRGLASRLIEELADLAAREGVERLYTEIPADDTPALELFRARGFKQVARLDDHILDRKGKYHDLVLFCLELA
jgi:ribosomal protein S18 acetylase RimI-like enzyme